MAKFQSLADFLGVEDPSEDSSANSSEQPSSSLSSLPAKLTRKAFCRAVLDSREYKESLYRRIVTDTLPAAVEIELYNRAEGKVTDKVEVKDATLLEKMSVEQLEDRALALIARTRQLRKKQKDEEAEPMPPSGEGVH